LTIGNFDGCHLGHQEILKKVITVSNELSLPSYIVTFEPNPKLFFKKESTLLQTPAQRLSALRSSGVDGIFVVDFLKARSLSGEEFIKAFLIDRFRLKHLVVGEDFRFGKNRCFTIDMMCQNLAKHQAVCSVVKQVDWHGVPISSSRIRERVRIGDVEDAKDMLGRPYTIEGAVVKGDGIGSKIGFPTINVKTDNTLLPKGVFITKVSFPKRVIQAWGVTNVGTRPTVAGCEERIETYLPDVDANLYGADVVISFQKKIRPEICFETTRQLGEQISQDVEFMQAYLKTIQKAHG